MLKFKDFLSEIKKPTGELKKACWKGYTAIGTKKKNGKTVPNCVPEEYMIETEDQHNFTDYKDWKQHAIDNKYKLVHGAWDTSAWKKDTHMGRFDGKKNEGFMKKVEPKKRVKKSV